MQAVQWRALVCTLAETGHTAVRPLFLCIGRGGHTQHSAKQPIDGEGRIGAGTTCWLQQHEWRCLVICMVAAGSLASYQAEGNPLLGPTQYCSLQYYLL